MMVLTARDRTVLWSAELPTTWITKPIKYAVQINARSLPESTPGEEEFEYIDISSVDFDGNIGIPTTVKFEIAPSRARRIVINGDTIVSTVRTYLKATAYVPKVEGRLICSTGFAVLTPGLRVDSRFLFYWMRSTQVVDEISARSVGVSYPAINASEIGCLPVPLLDMNDQLRISSFLQKRTRTIDVVIAKKQRLIELLQEKRQALITQAVTKGLDPSVPMKDSGIEWLGEIPAHWELIKLKRGIRLINQKADDMDSYLPYIGLENVESFTGRLLKGDLQNMPDGASNICLPAHVLFGKLRPYLAKVLRPPCMSRCTSELLVFEPVSIIRDYLFYYCLTKGFIETVNASTYGAKMPRANWDFIGQVTIPVPPKIEQNGITEYLNKKIRHIDDTIAKKLQLIELYHEYRQALISAAVTGKIDVREEVAACP